jgi:hypothetical protein
MKARKVNESEDLEPAESLIRVRASRRGTPLDLRVHYEVTRRGGCDTYRILAIDEID